MATVRIDDLVEHEQFTYVVFGGSGDSQVDPGQRRFVCVLRSNPGAGGGAGNLACAADDANHAVTTVNVEGVIVV